jgi:hypothetical protein
VAFISTGTSQQAFRRIMMPSSLATPLQDPQISQGKTDQYLIPVPATTHKTPIMYSEFLMVPYLLCFQYSTQDKTDELGPHKRLSFQIHFSNRRKKLCHYGNAGTAARTLIWA